MALRSPPVWLRLSLPLRLSNHIQLKITFSYRFLHLTDPLFPTFNPGKNDSLYMGKVSGSPICEQKRYLPFPYRDILDVINGSGISDEHVFTLAFEMKLPFSLFHRF